jgi:DNA-binding response OmpR family regulator
MFTVVLMMHHNISAIHHDVKNKTKHLPIIFISAVYKENYHKIRGIETGAVDFITKPIIPEILVGKVRVFLDLYNHKFLQ